jgi:CBS-domain-containing membrane protein
VLSVSEEVPAVTNIPAETRVAALMSREIISCPAGASLASIASTIAKRKVHAVFVLDDAGRPAGVVSDFDLLAGEWLGTDAERFQAMQRMTAAELMVAPVETISETATATEAAARLRELRISRLLVVDELGSAAGVISISDLVAPLGRLSGQRSSVRDVMSHAIVTCPPDASPESIARAMTERKSRSVVVVDEGGRAVGVITGTDLLSLYGPGERVGTAAELIRRPLITADPDLALTDAADLMISHEVHRLVVVDPAAANGAPIGMVSASDIVAEMAQEQSVWQHAGG